MNQHPHKMASLAAASLWALAGLLAGVALGLAGEAPFRITVFLATLGLAVGWFGFTGTYGRLNGKVQPRLLLSAPNDKALPEPKPVAPAAPFRAEDHIFSSEEAREWLDDFLVRQQQK